MDDQQEMDISAVESENKLKEVRGVPKSGRWWKDVHSHWDFIYIYIYLFIVNIVVVICIVCNNYFMSFFYLFLLFIGSLLVFGNKLLKLYRDNKYVHVNIYFKYALPSIFYNYCHNCKIYRYSRNRLLLFELFLFVFVHDCYFVDLNLLKT
uniref:Pecanex-like protein n=1 Tax=Heterorhabditis bacteriophora TaxID=37862 RepID=A0A1I7WTL3_HETBA